MKRHPVETINHDNDDDDDDDDDYFTIIIMIIVCLANQCVILRFYE